jgi:hypothetical protein
MRPVLKVFPRFQDNTSTYPDLLMRSAVKMPEANPDAAESGCKEAFAWQSFPV